MLRIRSGAGRTTGWRSERRRRRGLGFLALAVTVGLVPWIVGAQRPASAAPSGTLTITLSGNPNVSPLDPLGPTSAQDTPELYTVFEPLFEANETGVVRPALATSYKVANGGKSLVLNLRKGVKFSDGTPWNAAAAVYNIQAQADPKSLGECKTYDLTLKSVEATGPYQVTVNFSAPDPLWLSIEATQPCALIVSPTAYKKEGAKNFGNHPVGTGPFTESSYQLTSASFKANPHYWQKGEPKVSQINFDLVGDSTAALNAVRSGQAQIDLNPTPQDLVNAKTASGISVVRRASSDPLVVGLQSGSAPFNNKLARQALAYATNPAAIVNSFGQGVYQVSHSTIGTKSWAYPGAASVSKGYPSYNPAKAKALVKKLGGLKFTILFDNTPANVSQVEALQAQYKSVGIDMTLNPLVENTFITLLHGRHYQAFWSALGGGPTPPADPDAIISRWLLSTSPLNQGNFVDKTLDKYIDQSETTFNQKARKAAFAKVNAEINRGVPWVYIYNLPAAYLVSNSVKGLSTTQCLSTGTSPCTFAAVTVGS